MDNISTTNDDDGHDILDALLDLSNEHPEDSEINDIDLFSIADFNLEQEYLDDLRSRLEFDHDILLFANRPNEYFGYDFDEDVIDRRVALESVATYRPATIPASKSAVGELEKVRLESVESAREFEVGLCSICMEDFKEGVEATRLPCKHVYHGDCIVQWLEISHKCPLCRFEMPHDQSS